MPRLTWNRSNQKDIDLVKEAFTLYTKRRFIARHNGKVVKTQDELRRIIHDSGEIQVLEFELGPSAFDRVMKETDPWES